MKETGYNLRGGIIDMSWQDEQVGATFYHSLLIEQVKLVSNIIVFPLYAYKLRIASSLVWIDRHLTTL